MRISLSINKAVSLAFLKAALILGALGVANASSYSVQCKIGSSRSSVAVRGAGLNGKYFAKIISGEQELLSEEKATNGRHVVDFRFDSDVNAINGGAISIPTDFINNRTVVGIMRKADTNAFMGGVRATCTTRKAQTN